jgi:hypothetical protein
MEKETIVAIAVGIGLAASSGFRVFVPMLVAALAAKTGIIPLNESFQWLGSWAAIAALATATVIEVAAYYIPFVDNLLDTLATPLSVGAGTLLLTSLLPIDNELIKWITGFIVGGGTAATVQGGTVLMRLASSKFTAGIGNPVVATGENAAAFGTSVLSLFTPLIIAAAVILTVVYIILRFGRKLFRREKTASDS